MKDVNGFQLFLVGVKDVNDGVDITLLVEQELSQPFPVVRVAHVYHADQGSVDRVGQFHCGMFKIL